MGIGTLDEPTPRDSGPLSTTPLSPPTLSSPGSTPETGTEPDRVSIDIGTGREKVVTTQNGESEWMSGSRLSLFVCFVRNLW